MVMAALMANGVSEITNIKLIDRGYDDIEGKLTSLGADIVRTELTQTMPSKPLTSH